MSFTDNSRVEMSGLVGRAICDRLRPAITEGVDDHGAYLRFSTEAGDLSANEAEKYKDNLKAAPRRAMVTIEPLGNIPRWGKWLSQHAGVLIELGPMVKPNLFVALMQWNAAPAKSGIAGAPPPAEFGFRSVNIMKDGRAVKDAKGIPMLEERFYYTLRSPAGEHTILSNRPVVRGLFYPDIGVGFADGRGGPGEGGFWLKNQLQGRRFAGPTG